MRTRYLVFAAVLALGTAASIYAGDATGQIEVGYTYVDEEGNPSANQETFNTYEGMVLSLNKWRWTNDNGFSLRADLNRITVNNRDLNLSATQAGKFGISMNNNQYRRVYSVGGDRFTRRRATGGQAYFMPSRNFRLFTGFSTTDKHGENTRSLIPITDPSRFITDYKYNTFNIGLRGSSRMGSLRLEYRTSKFEDRATADRDRDGRNFRLSSFALVPGAEWVGLQFGYNYRLDELKVDSIELKTNLVWAGTKLRLPYQITAEYRLMVARTARSDSLEDTDNYINTFSIAKRFAGHGGLRIGYENRIADDFIDETNSNSILLGGWFNYDQRLYLKARMTIRDKTVESGQTLLGDEDVTRQSASVKYRFTDWGDAALSWDGRTRENTGIGSKIDYNSLTGEFNLSLKEYGKATLTQTYYLGQYDFLNEHYEFSDHLFTGTITGVEHSNITPMIGGRYYRSRRDNDVEKFSVTIGGTYRFLEDHFLEVRLNSQSFDNLVKSNEYYTGNIVEITLIKDMVL